MGAFDKYNYALNTPYSAGDVPFSLVRTHISAQVTKEPYHDFVFSPLVGAAGTKKGQTSVIAFNATPQMVKDGAAKVTIPMRRAVPMGTLPSYGDTMHVSFSDNFASNLSTGINMGEISLYAGRIRYSETLKGKESERMIQYLAIFEQMAEQLTETATQNLEEEVIFALHIGYSRNVTTYKGRGGSADLSHFQITPETFKRSNLNGALDMTGLKHPNTTFPRVTTHLTGANKTGAEMIQAMQTVANAGDQASLDMLDNVHEYCIKRKMKKVATPMGAKFLWFIPSCVATALRQSDDWRVAHEALDSRDGQSLLWSHALGSYADVMPIESEYIYPATGELNDDGGVDSQVGWGIATAGDIWPTYIVGQGALGMAIPKGVSTSYEEYDGQNVRILIADKVHGLRRADFFDDAETRVTSDAEAQPGQSPSVWNWSSAVLWVYQPATVF